MEEYLPKKNNSKEEISIDNLELSVRTYQALKNIGIKNLADIFSKGVEFFNSENIQGFNNKSVEEVRSLFKEKN